MLVTKDEGWYREKGKPAQKLKPCDVVAIPPNVKHWHGASKDCEFTHIAIEVHGVNPKNEWCEEVCDEEYNAINKFIINHHHIFYYECFCFYTGTYYRFFQHRKQ